MENTSFKEIEGLVKELESQQGKISPEKFLEKLDAVEKKVVSAVRNSSGPTAMEFQKLWEKIVILKNGEDDEDYDLDEFEDIYDEYDDFGVDSGSAS
ncbi:MAG: hypothetical protein H6581_11735 [Bacteroidia bacterium]|nr:hypothetical protein [Bacteroidia bacterium]